MPFEMTVLLLGLAAGGLGLAGYWDLRTTEFPDWLPYAMIIITLAIRGSFSFLTGDYSLIISSLLVGSAFLGLGLGLYLLKQWGDGDAWLLGVMGFAFPDSAGFPVTTAIPFPAALLFNFFLVAFAYLLVYSVILGLRSPEKSRKFLRELRGAWPSLGRLVGGFTVAVAVLAAFSSIYLGLPIGRMLYMAAFPPILLSVLVFMRYGRFVEANLFKRKIPASRLREGDVLVSDRWRGLTAGEVEKLRKKGGEVWIKEGIRFAPVFLITLVVTLLWGSLIMVFV